MLIHTKFRTLNCANMSITYRVIIERKKAIKDHEVREQHGFITMQLTRTFGSLADTYGHIIRTNLLKSILKMWS